MAELALTAITHSLSNSTFYSLWFDPILKLHLLVNCKVDIYLKIISTNASDFMEITYISTYAIIASSPKGTTFVYVLSSDWLNYWFDTNSSGPEISRKAQWA
jgi:hypothetical protein